MSAHAASFADEQSAAAPCGHRPGATHPHRVEPLEPRVFLSAAAPGEAPDDAPGLVVPQNQYIVVLKDGVNPHNFARGLADRGADVHQVYSHALKGVAFRGKAPVNDPRVAFIERDLVLSTTGQVLPTGVNRIEVDGNAVAKIDGSDERVGVDIAVIDTGIDKTHPDLNVYKGRNFAGGSANNWNDGHGHGTHVAGTAAALDNGAGVVGVAPGARLWGVRVLNNAGMGFLSNIIKGIDWVTANAEEIDVANMSLGGTGKSDAYHRAIQKSVAAGVVYTVAAGNSGADVYGSDGVFNTSDDYIPAAYPEVATISALADTDGQPGGFGDASSYGLDDSFATFSNFSRTEVKYNPVDELDNDRPGAAIDLLLPGVNIYSTYKSGGYATMSGTSMASPHAAGLAALCIAAAGDRDFDDNGVVDQKDVYAVRQLLIDGGKEQRDADGLAHLTDPDPHWERLGWAGPVV